MALVTVESSRLARLLRLFSGLSINERPTPTPMTPSAARGSTTMATTKSPVTISSDWRPADTFETTVAVAAAFIIKSDCTCPSRSVDCRVQLDPKNPVTMRVRVPP